MGLVSTYAALGQGFWVGRVGFEPILNRLERMVAPVELGSDMVGQIRTELSEVASLGAWRSGSTLGELGYRITHG